MYNPFVVSRMSAMQAFLAAASQPVDDDKQLQLQADLPPEAELLARLRESLADYCPPADAAGSPAVLDKAAAVARANAEVAADFLRAGGGSLVGSPPPSEDGHLDADAADADALDSTPAAAAAAGTRPAAPQLPDPAQLDVCPTCMRIGYQEGAAGCECTSSRFDALSAGLALHNTYIAPPSPSLRPKAHSSKRTLISALLRSRVEMYARAVKKGFRWIGLSCSITLHT